MAKTTPMMQQYRRIKERHADAILFFRLGDFYEMFSEDAVHAARALEITLTKRGKGTAEEVPMCGVPWHSADRYIARLTKLGYKVAICDQVEDASQAKGLVERDVVRVVTPGTDLSDGNLDPKENTWLAAVVPVDEGELGLGFVDSSTGEMWIAQQDRAGAVETLSWFSPREVIHPEGTAPIVEDMLREVGLEAVTRGERPAWSFERAEASRRLREHLGVKSLEGFGCEGIPRAERAAGGILQYLLDTQKAEPGHIRRVRRYEPSTHLRVDATTRRNLELTRSLRENDRSGSLLDLLDETATAMGGRLLKSWLLAPLQETEEIETRLDAVEALLEDERWRRELHEELAGVSDLERLTAKVRLGRATPRELGRLRRSLEGVAAVRRTLEMEDPVPLIRRLRERVDPLEDLYALLDRALVDEPPPSQQEGGLFRAEWNEELDELRDAARGGRKALAEIERREKDRTGIGSLKVRHNKVFGYFLEVSKANLDKVPEEWTRRQTLTNAERYVTEELKEIEGKVLGAQERSVALEERLFRELRERVGEETERLQATARAVAALDVLAALAVVADRYGYTRPVMRPEAGIRLIGARHPVVETLLREERFVPNDCVMDVEERQILLLTGPNMGGKSTYLRQTALIVLMAHVGSFVPAQEAEIGLVDRIFTRVGASDSLASGQSTFMVEMLETANILHNAGPRSLVVLDEVGRGTATFDGLSIAWAVVEHLHEAPDGGCLTLFATHYHELTDLAETLPRVRNLRVAAREWEDQIVFLHRVEEGTAERSYGIHVARLAGLPSSVLARAREILANLERTEWDHEGRPRLAASPGGRGPEPPPSSQMSLFAPAGPRPEVEEIQRLDLEEMSPLEALNYLADLQGRLRGQDEKAVSPEGTGPRGAESDPEE